MRLNRRFFQLLIGGLFTAAAVSIEAIESFKVLRELVPARLTGMVSQLDVLVLFFVGILFLWLGKNEHHEESQAAHHLAIPPVQNINTANATGGSVNITNTFQVPVDELAEAVAKRVRQEILNPGDGFVQIDDKRLELQVPSNPLRAGQTFSLKYFCENRGGLPVYDVQSWGILNILSPELNAMDRLKQLMYDAAIQGREKFPNHGSTLGAGGESFNYAVLADPLTDEQIRGMKAGTLSLFFMVGGVWRDNDNKFHYWSDGRKADFPDFPSVSPSTWRG